MIGLEINTKFNTPEGGIETLIFKDAYNYILEDDDEPSKKITFNTSKFEELLEKQQYIPKLVESPHRILNDYQKNDRDSRLKYLVVLRDLVHENKLKPTVLSTYHKLIEVVEKKHPETQATIHPAHKTICSHWKTWVKSNFENDAVASKCRHAPTRINAESEAQLQHHIATLWSSSDSKYRNAHYNAYKINTEEAKSNPSVKVVSKRTFYRRLTLLSEISDRLNSPSTSQAEKNQLRLTLRQRIRTHYAMQRIEVDRMAVNMCLVDDITGEPTTPISIYTAIDCYTGCPVGVVVDYGQGENKENVLNLLRQIYLTDENLIASGKPTVLLMDNGPGFNCSSTQKTCERANLSLVYTPPNQGSKKPFVEGFNHTLRQEFFRGMYIIDSTGQSTVGFNSYKGKRTDKGNQPTDKKLQKYADIKVSDFLFILNKFITEYINKVHKSRNVAPIMSWNQSIKNTKRPHYTYDTVKHCFHVFQDKSSNKLQPNGTVRCLKQDFFSNELKLIHIKMSGYKNNGENPTVFVHYDPFDARHVTVSVQVPGTSKPVEIIAKNIDLDIMPKAISFDECNGYLPKSYGIFQDIKHEISGDYKCTIHLFMPQKQRKNRSGKPISSFNENNELGIDVITRINNANAAESKQQEVIVANIESTKPDTENKPVLSQKRYKKTTPKGKDRKW
jgi:putative transposase